MTDIRKLLATNIRAYRAELGLTQSKLAEKVETATHYIAMIEGCKKFPSAAMLERIAAALERDTPELFAMNPVQDDWKEEILFEMNEFIVKKLEYHRQYKTKPENGPKKLTGF
ncbi:MAG: helix-turn-helix transcriptional regulator [Treponema sp.]|jgi:transcriptional regulator with XRE-family HTH domain|nr:helix-turn-helix transcriptional regulator [Treponema sp.]